MRYVIAIGIAALLVGAVHAQYYNPNYPGGQPGLPTSHVNGAEAVVYEYDAAGVLVPTQLCRVFKEDAEEGACNKCEWPLNFTVDASIAQWVEWSITYTDADFWVLKPGTYVVDSVAINIKSNGDVQLKADYWADLLSPTSGKIIPVEITILPCGQMPGSSTTWYAASALQGKYVLMNLIEEEIGDTFHYDGVNAVMWIRITVDECNTACDYYGGGQFFVQLDSQKAWVDCETGSWDRDFFN